MQTSAAPDDAPLGLRLLIADDDPGVRAMYATLLRATAGVTSVIEADDGATAVEVARDHDLDVAVLDLNMPRLDGLAAAVRLRALRPSLQIAFHSSDPEPLRARAADVEAPLFDKGDVERLLAWVERQSSAVDAPAAPIAPKDDLYCVLCGYGIASRRAPERCPMCGEEAAWVKSIGRER